MPEFGSGSVKTADLAESSSAFKDGKPQVTLVDPNEVVIPEQEPSSSITDQNHELQVPSEFPNIDFDNLHFAKKDANAKNGEDHFLETVADQYRREFVPTDEEQAEGVEFNFAKAQAYRKAVNLISELRHNLDRSPESLDKFLSAYTGELATTIYKATDAEMRAENARLEAENEKQARELANLRAAIAELEAKKQTERADTAEAKAESEAQRADYDTLTGLRRRDRYIRDSEALLERVQYPDSGRRASVIMGDLDNFGVLNKKYGVKFGDKVLSEAGKVFNRSLRSTDVTGRWGGEELVATAETEDPTFQPAERILENLRRMPVGEVTGSFGTTLNYDGDTLDTMFERASYASDLAKLLGKNRVISAEKNDKGDFIYKDLTKDENGDRTGHDFTINLVTEIQENEVDGEIVRTEAQVISTAHDLTTGQEYHSVKDPTTGKPKLILNG